MRLPFALVLAREGRAGGGALENHRSLQGNSGRAREQSVPSLTCALAIAFGLVGIDLSHLLEKIPGIRSRDIRRPGAVALPLLGSPWQRRLLDALRHGKRLEDKSPKGKLANEESLNR